MEPYADSNFLSYLGPPKSTCQWPPYAGASWPSWPPCVGIPNVTQQKWIGQTILLE
jgi:hypothetical protein